MEQDKLLTAGQVANRLRLHLMTVYEWSKTGKLNPVRIGSRTVRFRESEIEELMKGGGSR